MTAPEPFSGPRYRENKARCKGDDTPCAWCGKPVKEPWRFAVRVVAGGAEFAPQDAPDDGGAEMGCWPVGAACAKVLRDAGVPVFAWRPAAQPPAPAYEEADGLPPGALDRDVKIF